MSGPPSSGGHLQIGADPEFFIVDPNGKSVPAFKFFPPKEEKIPLYEGDKRETYFRDGYALEVNPLPSPCFALMQNSAKNIINAAKKKLSKGFDLIASSRVEVDPKEASGKDAPKDAKTFGCMPAMNAYLGRELLPDINARSHKYRYAGGHLHFSTTDTVHADPKGHCGLVKYIDLKVGLPMAVFQLDIPEVFQRREYYGRAGEFRSQVYPGATVRSPSYPGEAERYWKTSDQVGVEYRVPGSEIFRHPGLVFLFGNMIRRAIRAFNATARANWDPSIEGELQLAINTGVGAEALLKKFDTPLYDVMAQLREVKDLKKFQYPTSQECHTGFSQLHESWGVRIPNLELRDKLCADGRYS